MPLLSKSEGLLLTDSTFVRVQAVDFPGETVVDLAFGDGLFVLTPDTLYKLRFDGSFTGAVFGGILRGAAVVQRRSDGKVFVVDEGAKAVWAYPSDGSPMPETVLVDTSWVAPRGVEATDKAIFVADSALDVVFRYTFDTSGVRRDTFLGPGEGFLNARGPGGLFLDYQNTLWVVSSEKHWANRVGVIPPPALLGHVGDSLGVGGRDAGRLFLPRDVSGDLFGRVVLADFGNRRLQIFSAQDGRFLQAFASPESLAPFSVVMSADGKKIWAGFAGRLERYETPQIPQLPDEYNPGDQGP